MLKEIAQASQETLARKLATEKFDFSLCTASMDHCPSEQLSDDEWHTSSLIVSSHIQHDDLATRVHNRIKPNRGTPGKWSGLLNNQKENFLAVFFEELRVSSGIAVLSISAHAETIRKELPRMLVELEISHLYQAESTLTGKKRVVFGPVTNCATGEQITVRLAENRASMCVFIAHFVHRMKAVMHAVANSDGDPRPSHVNWNFLADKFAGPTDRDMTLLFRVLLSYSRETGRLAYGYFDNESDQMIDLLADQLAGALDAQVRGTTEVVFSHKKQSTPDSFYWEVWPILAADPLL